MIIADFFTLYVGKTRLLVRSRQDSKEWVSLANGIVAQNIPIKHIIDREQHGLFQNGYKIIVRIDF